MKHRAGWVAIPKRPLTAQERSWVKEILAASKEWADVTIGELFAVGRCPCGFCRAIQLEQSEHPQNPKATGRGQIGDIDIHAQAGDIINVALYASNGSLTDLDVLCEFSSKSVPDTWTEVSRYVEAK
jgi:hypothetical protein